MRLGTRQPGKSRLATGASLKPRPSSNNGRVSAAACAEQANRNAKTMTYFFFIPETLRICPALLQDANRCLLIRHLFILSSTNQLLGTHRYSKVARLNTHDIGQSFHVMERSLKFLPNKKPTIPQSTASPAPTRPTPPMPKPSPCVRLEKNQAIITSPPL